MPSTGLLPATGAADAAAITDPQEVVEAFLRAMADPDVERALALAHDDIEWINVGLPAVRGRDRVGKVLRGLDRPAASFEVYLHAISAEGSVVLTERTDVLCFGPLRVQFWVWGRFEVHDGKVRLWRDSFDNVDIFRAVLRGVIGVPLPALRPKAPTRRDAAPGR